MDRHRTIKSPVKRSRLVGGRRLDRHGQLPHVRFADLLESLCSSDRTHPRAANARPDGLTRSIGFHSHLLYSGGLFNAVDREDLEQELILRVLGARRRIDPSLGTATAFLRTVVANHARRIRERALLEERALAATRRRVRLQAGDRELAWERDRLAWDRREDVRGVVGRLPPGDRRMAELLMRCTVAEAARRLGVSRITLRKRIRCLREKFASSVDCF